MSSSLTSFDKQRKKIILTHILSAVQHIYKAEGSPEVKEFNLCKDQFSLISGEWTPWPSEQKSGILPKDY